MCPSSIQFLAIVLVTSQVSASGVFKLELFQFKNDNGLLNNRTCCSGSQINNVCTQTCRTYFRICIKHFQTNISPGGCSYGEFTTDVMGNNSFSFPKNQGVFTNPLQFRFPFAWPGDFSLIIDAYHEVSTTPRQSGLIATFQGSSRTPILPSDDWQSKQWNSTESQSISFRYRVECDATYYGDGCTTICTERDDELGHYECDAQGAKVCRQGWQGEYCDKAICLEGCSKEHGSCRRPNECSCNVGWEGKYCNQCITYPNCEHGYCHDSFECICNEGWGGLYCNQDLNYCTNKRPCKNGGTCTNTGAGSYTCTCPLGYTGVNCEVEIDNCAVNSCLNGGTCRDVGDDFECQCLQGFSGAKCENKMETCRVNPCANGGWCESLPISYKCHCEPGWHGVNCQTEIDECMQREGDPEPPCKNNGQCVDGLNSYSCVCPEGFSGQFCEINEDECAGESPCLNGGECIDGANRYQCRCRPGFIGDLCEIDVDDCAALPCANGGSCLDKVNDFECRCAPGYQGRMCNEEVNECASSPCVIGHGTCEDLLNDYMCHCSPEYEGRQCQYRLGSAPTSTSTTRTTTPIPSTPSTPSSTQSKAILATPKAGAVKTASEQASGQVELTQPQLILIVCLGSGIPMLLLLVLVSILLYRRCRRRVEDDKSLEARQNQVNSMNNRIHNPVGGDRKKLSPYEYPTAEKMKEEREVAASSPPMSLDYKNSSGALTPTKVVHKDLIKDINRAKERHMLGNTNSINRHLDCQSQLMSAAVEYRQPLHSQTADHYHHLSSVSSPQQPLYKDGGAISSPTLQTVCGRVTPSLPAATSYNSQRQQESAQDQQHTNNVTSATAV